MELDERKKKILHAIIQNYMETGEPVGSRTISKYSDLKLSSATIRNEMSDLEELGYLDDAAYARTVARHYAAKGYGERKIRDELYRRGVDRALWDEALDELPSDGEQIDRFLQSKLHGRSPEDKEKKRLTDALLRRGFSWGEVKSAWGRYGSEVWED